MSLLTAIVLLAPGAQPPQPATPAAAVKVVPVEGGLSPHFRRWLEANGFAGHRFERADLTGGSYGGRRDDQDPVTRRPVVFVHGNTDKALGTGSGTQTGWNASLEHFLAQGYTPAELYATTWGPADLGQATLQYHAKAHLTRLRAFLQAVLAYTGAKRIDVVAHSMGVTLARKAIIGGTGDDPADGGAYDLGPPLTERVETSVGIAGANLGLLGCLPLAALPTCGPVNGFFPGDAPGKGPSAFLAALNAVPHREAQRVFTIWSTRDDLIGPGSVAWGRPTCRIPGQDGEKCFTTAAYGHVPVKDLTAHHQYRMVAAHTVD